MKFPGGTLLWRWVLPAFALGLPALLLISSYQTFQRLEEQRAVYLRSRAAAIAAHLETLPAGLTKDEIAAYLAQEEPQLVTLDVLSRQETAADPELTPLWEGRELFRTRIVTDATGALLYRATVPFHADNQMLLARMELPASAGDFLLVPARRNLIASTVVSLAVIGLALVAAWSVRRHAIVEQRRLELEYLAQIGSMSAVLAHEIRNPLGTMKGFAQLLAERTHGEHRDLLDPIVEEARRLEALVQDLLLYGRPQQPVWKTIDTATFAASLQAHGGPVLRIDVPGASLQTDPQLLEQAMLNLIRNAREAVENVPSPEVRLTMTVEGPAVRWSIADNGPGFSKKALDRLFVPFHTTKAFGTGLGLAITQKLIRTLGGNMQVLNQSGEGGGAVVHIVLPLKPPGEPRHG
jgi:two-component system sensor histidine kinase HydH